MQTFDSQTQLFVINLIVSLYLDLNINIYY